MDVRNCSFCGKSIEPASGFLYVRKDGSVLNFCSRKCKENMVKLKRVPRKVKWTNEYHRIKAMTKKA
ncbi:50S ribosomal protein L24e [Picrophilus oshimae]|uniref:Large ribosomal subunit protein eL24 n=2 Tax=Picrophilus torridus (strain ATCC 700027 / DSM 9790 / JCM 10055 / NBRC 100828 / KAW 2/3) TaxID=1122961 RepID=RL24E_PICTO|nr:50S ribosomal protein L24e [Picrophilus oshimae]Q6KZI5.1 RecName: Full=Large ribosomal subunit protein eL24; AltName: Full=50S ribosomal protein L24e [Picrophilus oshimae DSM 9789]AAT43867.1 large subunit ribosomal protein L24E [Picrophilus oshimae DSM 9789]SMD31064.1 LSU ribosomal protein L24E [Picrophilus oshimae DSM 9789]